jgi:hypothetical protein
MLETSVKQPGHGIVERRTGLQCYLTVRAEPQRSRPVRGELLLEAHLLAPILNILVLHTGQVPSVAGRPFFIVIGLAFVISRVVLHFMQ